MTFRAITYSSLQSITARLRLTGTNLARGEFQAAKWPLESNIFIIGFALYLLPHWAGRPAAHPQPPPTSLV